MNDGATTSWFQIPEYETYFSWTWNALEILLLSAIISKTSGCHYMHRKHFSEWGTFFVSLAVGEGGASARCILLLTVMDSQCCIRCYAVFLKQNMLVILLGFICESVALSMENRGWTEWCPIAKFAQARATERNWVALPYWASSAARSVLESHTANLSLLCYWMDGSKASYGPL